MPTKPDSLHDLLTALVTIRDFYRTAHSKDYLILALHSFGYKGRADYKQHKLYQDDYKTEWDDIQALEKQQPEMRKACDAAARVLNGSVQFPISFEEDERRLIKGLRASCKALRKPFPPPYRDHAALLDSAIDILQADIPKAKSPPRQLNAIGETLEYEQPKIVLDRADIFIGKRCLNNLMKPETLEFLLRLASLAKERSTMPLPYEENTRQEIRDEDGELKTEAALHNWKFVREQLGEQVGAEVAKRFVRNIHKTGYRLQPGVQVVEHGKLINVDPSAIHAAKHDRSGQAPRQRQRKEE